MLRLATEFEYDALKYIDMKLIAFWDFPSD
jgi:hypothetical protein